MAEILVADPATARPRLVAPADGVVVALDPDIPPLRQRVTIIVSGAPTGAVLAVDGRPLPASRDGSRLTALWEPVPGVHVITLADREYVFDRTRLTVR